MAEFAQSIEAETNRPALEAYGAATHEVLNQPFELVDANLFSGDAALKEGVAREGAGWASPELEALGARLGAAETLELGALANRLSARTRHARPLRPPRRSRALPFRLSRADARRDRDRAAFLALDRSAGGRPCRARGAILPAG